MKKQYEKPEVFSEDISKSFAGACCVDIPETPNPYFLTYCADNCAPGESINYAQAG